MPVRVRLALLLALGTAVAVTIAGAVFVHELAGGLRSSLVASLQSQASAIAQQLPAFSDPGGESLAQVIGAGGRILEGDGPGSGRPVLDAAQLERSRRQGVVLERRIHGASSPYLVYATGISDSSKRVVVVGTTLETVDQAVGRVERGFVVGGAVAVLAAAAAAWFLAGAALRPVERMRRQASAISALDHDATLAVPRTRDEVAALAQTLNGLLGRLQGALGRQRGFVAVAGHELRTPLAILRGGLELARKPGRSVDELTLAIDEATVDTDHLIRLTDDLLLLSRDDEGVAVVDPVPQNVVPVLWRTKDAFAQWASDKNVDLVVEAPDRIVAAVDDLRLRQAVDNLVANSLRMAPLGTQVRIRLVVDGAHLVIEVLDEGPGFPAEFLPRAFDRFSRPDTGRDRQHGGAGLGLAIVKALAEGHGGGVDARNRVPLGAIVRIVLPADGGGSSGGDGGGDGGDRSTRSSHGWPSISLGPRA